MGTYLIAEIGQNHNGSERIASELIKIAGQEVFHENKEIEKADAVKFQIRDLDYELNENASLFPYNQNNSFGDTYGKHREELELPIEAYKDLAEEARGSDLDVIVTVCNPTILEKVNKLIKPDMWKVASRDLLNIPLLEEINEMGCEKVILSTGMHSLLDIEKAVNELVLPDMIGILHCISAYPTQYSDLCLTGMQQIKDNFKGWLHNIKVGFSDHTAGVLAPSIAVALGAEIIEKHITLDHDMKGSDHFGSMNREGWQRVVRDVRNTENSIRECDRLITKKLIKEERQTWDKIGRVACYKSDKSIGDVLNREDIIMLSPPHINGKSGISWEQTYLKINKKITNNVKRGQII